MKKEGTLKKILAVLVIVLITMVSIFGIYVKDKNVMKNKLPDYKLGMELKDTNVIKMKIGNAVEDSSKTDNQQDEDKPEESADEQKNKENAYTLENYKKTKKIIEKRLKDNKIDQYTVRLDEKTGNMVIELPSKLLNGVVQGISKVGKLEIKIEDNNEVIATNKDIDSVKTSIDKQYANYQGYGSIVKMEIVFNNEASKKFQDMKNNYNMKYTQNDEEKTSESENSTSTTENTSESKEQNRTVDILIDGQSLFGQQKLTLEEFTEASAKGSLALTLGGFTNDKKDLDNSLTQANLNKSLMENENLPFEFTTTYTTLVHSNVKKNAIITVFVVALVGMLVYLFAKYKVKGVLGVLSIVGFISTLLLALRYSNVVFTIATICSLLFVMILEFIYLIKVLDGKGTSKSFNEGTMNYTKALIPVLIFSLVILFAKIAELSTIGQVVFWGILVFEIFNNIITRALLTDAKNK